MTFEAARSCKKSLDAHLDNEFVFLAQFIRFYKERVSCKDGPLCVSWLQRLLSPVRDGTARIVRNTYLAELLLAMQSGHLCGPFTKKPPKGALSLSPFQSTPEGGDVGEPAWLDTIINAPIPEYDDGDERTYIATQAHPDGQAAYAYLAVSTIDHDHWIDPLAASDNESAVNVTPPRSHAAPTACESCASINPIPENIQLPCAEDLLSRRYRARNANNGRTAERFVEDNTARSAYDTDALIQFYDQVLALVDCVLRTGCCSDDSFITDLLHRMKDQKTDPALLEMSSQEIEFELLRRLRTKLLNRREQAKRMKRAASASSRQEPSEEIAHCPVDLDVSLDEELWESAARRELSPTNMMLLKSVYPPQLVSRFVNALIRERCALIGRMRAEHRVLITSLKDDVQKDIGTSLDKFREARALWVLLLRATQELQHRRHELMNASEAEKGMALRETVLEIQDATIALDEEGKRGTVLANQLVSEQQDLYTNEREAERHAQRLLAYNDTLRMSLRNLEAQEAAQSRRISELQHMLPVTT